MHYWYNFFEWQFPGSQELQTSLNIYVGHPFHFDLCPFQQKTLKKQAIVALMPGTVFVFTTAMIQKKSALKRQGIPSSHCLPSRGQLWTRSKLPGLRADDKIATTRGAIGMKQ